MIVITTSSSSRVKPNNPRFVCRLGCSDRITPPMPSVPASSALRSFSLTPRFSGLYSGPGGLNRFNGFLAHQLARKRKTVETVGAAAVRVCTSVVGGVIEQLEADVGKRVFVGNPFVFTASFPAHDIVFVGPYVRRCGG